MGVVSWDGGTVSAVASIEVGRRFSGAALRSAYADALRAITFGLVRLEDDTVRIGPIDLLRFGRPAVTDHAVEWTVEGGLLARAPGGTWRIESAPGHVDAAVRGFRPFLAQPLYELTHLHVHQLFTRLFLLRLRAAEPVPMQLATRDERLRSAAVDVALCLALARLTGRRRPRRVLAIAVAYHVACWSISGRTLGGLVTNQRVVSIDGSRLTVMQSLYRLALVPLSWITRQPVHDERSGTTVIEDKEKGAANAAP